MFEELRALRRGQRAQPLTPAELSLAGARRAPYWLDQPEAPTPEPALDRAAATGLAVIGGGFTGLWTALLAKERDPDADVILLEGRTAGWAASGRNGGFCAASLTHGHGNGQERWPQENAQLDRLGRENLAEIAAAIERHGIDCHPEPTGELAVATAPWQLDGLAEHAELARALGHPVTVLDGGQMRAEVDSPTYLGGVWDRHACIMLDPARLAWGLRRACLEAGVRLHENSPVTALQDEGRAGVRVVTREGTVLASRVALAAGAFRPLLRRLGLYLVPVYDYVLMTEPLTSAQLASVGWRNRQGLADAANQFHYYRLTADNRILWGGYDAVYYNGGVIKPAQDQNPVTFAMLARHFVETFPQLAEVRFSHTWGGVIDTCSRFSVFAGTAYKGKLAYAAGYTGLGVGASRFGAAVMLDLLSGESTERTSLAMVGSKPVPFPPEPLRSAVIQMTRASIAAADRHEGRRNLWLRTLDRFGVGYDS